MGCAFSTKPCRVCGEDSRNEDGRAGRGLDASSSRITFCSHAKTEPERAGTSVAHSWVMAHRILSAGVLLCAFVSNAHGQSSERLYEGLSFRFVYTGSKSGGDRQNICRPADDATAAYSNRRGLSNLLEPEFHLIDFNSNQASSVRPSGRRRNAGVWRARSCAVLLSYAHPAGASPSCVQKCGAKLRRESLRSVAVFIPSIGVLKTEPFETSMCRASTMVSAFPTMINRYLSIGGSAMVSTSM